MIKVAFIVSTLQRKGPNFILKEILKYLDSTKFNPVIITLSDEKKDTMIEEFRNYTNQIFSISAKRFRLSNKSRLNKIISEIKPNIIHCHGFRPDIYVSKLKKSNKFYYCSTLHNIPNEDYIFEYGKIIGSVMAIIHLKSLKKADKIIACSNFIMQKYNQFFNNIISIQNGVSLSGHSNTNLNKTQLGLPENKKIILSVGKISKRKNALYVAKQFVKSKLYHDHCLVFLGDGQLMPKLIKFSQNFENIIVKGLVDNVQNYYSFADLFISASFSEGLPSSVLEALSYGNMVFLSDIPQHKEIIGENSIFNFFSLSEKDSLCKSLNRFDKNYNKDDIISFCQKLIMNFDSKQMSLKYQEIYERYTGN
jgi:glycosyltransferase involved in cell wall biosynthesis